MTLHLKDRYDLGGQFFLWEMATAVAGYFLGIQPFDQPDVEAAKVLAREMVARGEPEVLLRKRLDQIRIDASGVNQTRWS